MRWVDLFAGAGGASIGISRAGGKHVACYDLDPDAVNTLLAADLPAHKIDLAETSLAHLKGKVDAVWCSTPCQPWSHAGARKGAADERNLWPAALARIAEMRPTWAIFEQVPAALHHQKKAACDKGARPAPSACAACYFDAVILPGIRALFPHAQWAVLDAADFGVPQHRRRLFIVAGPRAVPWPRRTHGPGPCLRPWRTMGEALGLTSALGGGHNGTTGGAPILREIAAEPSPTILTMPSAQRGPFAVIGGGTNPHGPNRAHERTVRDLTAEPAPCVTAIQVGNAGPWVVSQNSPRTAVLDPVSSAPFRRRELCIWDAHRRLS